MNDDFTPIPGYEDYYAITRTGEVMSLHCRKKGKILKQIIDRVGYYKVSLNVKGKQTNLNVHRLLAITFISNPDNKPMVNHINGNKLDNSLSNLEWVTHSENMRHAIRLELICPFCKTKIIDKCSGEIYSSISEAAVVLQIPYNRLKRIIRNRNSEGCLEIAA